MSSSVAKPIIKQIKDRQDALDFFEHVSLPKEDEKTQEIIMNFPTVYIHNWQESGDFEVYVGESNDIFKRTRQHYDAASDNSKWQSKLLEKDASLFIIGHEHFNKSLTLDIENRLMHYMMSVDRVKHVHNLRDNPQTSYYPMEELDEIFSKIWRGLRKENKELFPTESVIKDSAIYKASPLHKLTKKQEKARELIIQKVSDALENGETKQLIFIDGEAGTGKTVLNSSTFYELYCQAEENNKEVIDEGYVIQEDIEAREEAKNRLKFFKHIIEECDGYLALYYNGKQIAKEKDLQRLFRFVWYGTSYKVDAEPNNGRGQADFIVSKGMNNQNIIEFKLASNSSLGHVFTQIKIYEAANCTDGSLVVIFYFTEEEKRFAEKVIEDSGYKSAIDESIFLIDCRKDNKKSASIA